MKKVFVVILNWNRKKLTKEALTSVGDLKIRNFSLKVVVVDNASTDGSKKALERHKFTNSKTDYKFLENQSNLGFAAGNNVGIEYAIDKGADYVVLMNNDAVADPQLIVQLLKVFSSQKKVGAASPKIYFSPGYEFHKKRYKKNDQGKVIWYAGGEMDWDNVLGSNRGVNEVDHGQYDKVIETDFATGACVMLSAKALKQSGYYDPKYFMYLEDGDLSMRMKKNGWKVLFAPKAICWHKVAQSSGIGSDLNDYYITRNRLIFGMRWAPIRAKLALIRESWKYALTGRKWQKKGLKDFYLGKYGKGSWN